LPLADNQRRIGTHRLAFSTAEPGSRKWILSALAFLEQHIKVELVKASGREIVTYAAESRSDLSKPSPTAHLGPAKVRRARLDESA
jgi:hypothetical protein